MMKVSESITNMRKAQNKREMEKKDLADVIEQEKLIEMKGELIDRASLLR
jgi:nucleosome binding factor SPN SPT16 subunit